MRPPREKMNKEDQPRKTRTEDALFIVKVRIIRGQKLIQQLMTPEDFQRTGLSKLTDQELANLNSWLDPAVGNDGLMVVADSSSF